MNDVTAASIVVVGSTMVDMIAYADRAPNAGETIVGKDFRTGFGGKGANQAVAAARFGARVAMVNAVGDDSYGAETIRNFEEQGVDATYVVRVPGSSGVAPIWVDATGMNRIICVPGANAHTPPALAERAVREVRPSVVVGQFEVPQPVTISGFRAAREIGAATILNPAPAAPIDPALLALSDWLVPNEHEFELLGGGALDGEVAHEDERFRAFAATFGGSLAVTLGVRGVAILERGTGSVVRVPAPVVTAIDSTGAGDAFVGAFAVGLAVGLSPADAARLGCAFASDSVTRHGTQSSLADRAGAAALLASIRGA